MKHSSRRSALDTLRGLSIASMIGYHTCWSMVYLFGVSLPWYRSTGAYLWQQSICWTFILLSGYCFSLGRHPLRRGLMTFGGGALVTLVTLVILPDSPILFGVLTLLGTAALLTSALDPALRRLPPAAGFILSAALFFLLRNVNRGTLGFGPLAFFPLPESWYHNLLTAFLGFPGADFVSSDYFSLLPWLFLFWVGYYFYKICPDFLAGSSLSLPVFTAMGRHALLLYLLHQPVIFLVLTVLQILHLL